MFHSIAPEVVSVGLLLTLAVVALPLGATSPMGRATVLVCDAEGTCAADAAWAASLGVPPEGQAVLLDAVLELDAGGWSDGADQAARFADALTAARTAAAAGRWSEVADQAAAGLDALSRWPGAASREDLYALWVLEGAARLHEGPGRGHESAFRQAEAVRDIREIPLPLEDVATARILLDERRKLEVAGRGTLVVTGSLPPKAVVQVDGEPLADGQREVLLLPGTHRVTVTTPGRFRTWKAEVPILGERASRVTVALPPEDEVLWVTARLGEVFDTLDAPPAVRDLLASWCAREGAVELELVRVEGHVRPLPPPPVAIGPYAMNRPAAAEGEPVEEGDGLPVTYEGQLRVAHQEAQVQHPLPEERRLRLVYFDPVTRTFSADGRTAAAWAAPPASPLRLGVRVGAAGFMDRTHATLDMVGEVAAGPVSVEGRVGLVRADEAYNLYTWWQDRQLWHLSGGVRWVPRPGPVAPYVGGGAEVYVPAAFGARLDAGVQADLGAGWRAQGELSGTLLDQGPGWGLAVGLTRRR